LILRKAGGLFAKRPGGARDRGRPGHVAAREWPGPWRHCGPGGGGRSTGPWWTGGGAGAAWTRSSGPAVRALGSRSTVDRALGEASRRGWAAAARHGHGRGARRGGDTRRGEARGAHGRAARDAAGPVRATAAAGHGRSARATRRRYAAAAANSGERGRVHGRERGRAEGVFELVATLRTRGGPHLGEKTTAMGSTTAAARVRRDRARAGALRRVLRRLGF
jgi:hypothetical protein